MKRIPIAVVLICAALAGCQTSGSSSSVATAPAETRKVLKISYDHASTPMTIYLDADNNVVGTEGPVSRIDSFTLSETQAVFSGRMQAGSYGLKAMTFELPLGDGNTFEPGRYSITSGCNQNCDGRAQASWAQP